MLTEEEKWSFDLHGYLVLKGTVPQTDIKRMVELCDTWHALDDSELPPPLKSYHDANTKPTTPRSINNVPYADEVFQRLRSQSGDYACRACTDRKLPAVAFSRARAQHESLRRYWLSWWFLWGAPQSGERLPSRQWRSLRNFP